MQKEIYIEYCFIVYILYIHVYMQNTGTQQLKGWAPTIY